MNTAKGIVSYICIRCLCKQHLLSARYYKNDKISRGFAQLADAPQEISKDNDDESKSTPEVPGQGQVEGRMSARLARMTDQMIEQSGQGAKKAIEDGGFSEDLKKKLEARLQESSFKSKNAAAFAQASLPVRPATQSHGE